MNQVRFFGLSFNKDSAINFLLIVATLGMFMVASPALAAGGLESLDKATDALEDISKWLYAFVGVGAVVYIIYLVGMALFEKKQWSDVGMGLGYCAIAGGIVMAAEWAIGLFTS